MLCGCWYWVLLFCIWFGVLDGLCVIGGMVRVCGVGVGTA